MKEFPQARALEIIQSGTITGKLNGVIPATTPSGSRTVWTSTPWPALGVGRALQEVRDAAPELDVLNALGHLAPGIREDLAMLPGDRGGSRHGWRRAAHAAGTAGRLRASDDDRQSTGRVPRRPPRPRPPRPPTPGPPRPCGRPGRGRRPGRSARTCPLLLGPRSNARCAAGRSKEPSCRGILRRAPDTGPPAGPAGSPALRGTQDVLPGVPSGSPGHTGPFGT